MRLSDTQRQCLFIAIATAITFAQPAFAQDVQTGVNNVLRLATTIMFIIAGFAALFGIVQAGIAISQGDMDAKRKMVWAFAGAAVIALGGGIVRAIFTAAGSTLTPPGP